MRVVVLPESRVLFPDALDELLFLHALRRLIDGCLRRAEVQGQAAGKTAHGLVAPRLDGHHQRGERFIERLDAVFGELAGDGLEAEPLRRERAHHRARTVEVLLQRQGHAAVILEGLVGRRRNGVDRVRPDQRLEIEHIAVRRILGAGRRPQRPLHVRAVMAQLLPTLAAEDLPEELVGEFGVGDGDLAEERADLRIVLLLELRLHLLFGQRVDAADEEAGHRGDLVDRQPLGHAALQTSQIGLHHLGVDVVREDQGDVDVDAVGDRFLDGRNALRRGRNLDHHVRPPQRGEEPLGLGGRIGRVVRQKRRDLQAAESVPALAAVVDRTEDVGGVADVFDGDGVVDLFARLVLRRQSAQLRVVVVAAADGLLEDGRIRRQTAQVVFIDHPLQIAARDQPPFHLIEPDALSRFRQFNKWIAHQNLREGPKHIAC